MHKADAKTFENGNAEPADSEDVPCVVDEIPTKSRQTSPPDGGWGWVVMFASMSISILIGATFYGFSIMYIEFVDAFGSTRAATAWIVSLSVGGGQLFGVFFGGAINHFGSRKVCFAGSVLAASGYITSYFATSVTYLYFTCGLMTGMGSSMMVVPSVVIVHQYFTKRRPLAIALSGFGYSLGGLIGGPFIQLLLDTYSWRGTLLIFGGVYLQGAVASLFFRPLSRKSLQHGHGKRKNSSSVAKPDDISNGAKSRDHIERNASAERFDVTADDISNGAAESRDHIEGNASAQRSIVKADDISNGAAESRDHGSANQNAQKKTKVCLRHILHQILHNFGFTLLSDVRCLLYVLSVGFTMLGLAVFFLHTPSRAVSVGCERHQVSLIPTIMGATMGSTRIVCGFVANIPGVNRLLQFSCFVIAAGIIQATTVFSTTFPTVVAFVILEGIACGGFLCIMSTNAVDINGVENAPRSQALLQLPVGLGNILGAPMAGFLFDVTLSYNVSFISAGCITTFGGSLGLMACWFARRRRKNLETRKIELQKF